VDVGLGVMDGVWVGVEVGLGVKVFVGVGVAVAKKLKPPWQDDKTANESMPVTSNGIRKPFFRAMIILLVRVEPFGS